MLDSYAREVDNLRIALTQKCNLNCFYCHREGEYSFSLHNEMTAAEIERIVRVASKIGIRKLKLTGGEPLLRDDIIEIVERTARYMQDISITTNGVLLEQYARGLRNAGLHRVNISFDTLDPKTYRILSGKNCLDRAIEGVRSAVEHGLHPVKLNMVVMRDINEHEINDLIVFSARMNTILQLIELEIPVENINGGFYRKYHLDLGAIEETLRARALCIEERKMHRRRKYIIPVPKGIAESKKTAEVEVVRGMHNTEFCSNCTRLRITSAGMLKPCLLQNDGLIDILTPLREGRSEEELINLFKAAIKNRKPYWE